MAEAYPHTSHFNLLGEEIQPVSDPALNQDKGGTIFSGKL